MFWMEDLKCMDLNLVRFVRFRIVRIVYKIFGRRRVRLLRLIGIRIRCGLGGLLLLAIYLINMPQIISGGRGHIQLCDYKQHLLAGPEKPIAPPLDVCGVPGAPGYPPPCIGGIVGYIPGGAANPAGG